jgi:hypothetical protein
MTRPTGDQFHISVGGSVGGDVVAGRDNQVIHQHLAQAGVSAADLAAFTAEIDKLKAQLAAAEPVVGAAAAEGAANLDALHAAAIAPTPDIGTMRRVRDWFVHHLPTLAGAVTGLIVHPLVGALVKSAGDAVTSQFHREFGTPE